MGATRTAAAAQDRPELSYEEARAELVDVVRRLESGGATLEESLTLWERGEELARICRTWLEGARARLDAALARDTDGDADADADGDGDGDGDESGAGEGGTGPREN